MSYRTYFAEPLFDIRRVGKGRGQVGPGLGVSKDGANAARLKQQEIFETELAEADERIRIQGFKGSRIRGSRFLESCQRPASSSLIRSSAFSMFSTELA